MNSLKVKINAFLLLYLAFIATLNAQEPLQKTTIWAENEDHYSAHFVYGLTVTTKGTILAFAEARIENGSDDGAHHIVLKRSTDQGKSFSPSKLVKKSTAGKSYTNPTVVQDRVTGTIFLFYALNYHNDSTAVYIVKSDDDGLNWSPETNVTPVLSSAQAGWTFHLPGPGHGIQLKNNRLLIPIWHRKSISFASGSRNYGVTGLYSDDHGRTWHSGSATPIGELNESQLVEQKNGDILLIGRTITGQGGSHQAKVWSKNQGKTWSASLTYDTALTGAACDIGLIRFQTRPNQILVSQPAGLKKRSELTIRMSTDEGKTWIANRVLEPGSSTYSDLAVLPDQTIICLFGHGGSGHMPAMVSLARFDMNWVLSGK